MNAFSITNAFPELEESRRHLFEESTIAIHEIDVAGVIRNVNQAECKLLGYATNDLIGHYIWEFVAAEHREISRQSVLKKIARAQPVAVFPREFRRFDGTYLWVEIHETLIEDAAGNVIGIRSGLIDITERRSFEKTMQEQHDRMRFLLRSWARAIVTTNPLGRVDFMNPAAETLTGWQQHDAMGRSFETICRAREESGEPVDLMSCILGDPETCNANRESLMLDRSGASRRVRWTTSPICNDDGVIIGAAVVFEEC